MVGGCIYILLGGEGGLLFTDMKAMRAVLWLLLAGEGSEYSLQLISSG